MSGKSFETFIFMLTNETVLIKFQYESLHLRDVKLLLAKSLIDFSIFYLIYRIVFICIREIFIHVTTIYIYFIISLITNF